jgi:hypothetical protein
MPDSVGLRWDLTASGNAATAFNIAAESANRLADDAQRAADNVRQLGRMSPNIRIQTNATSTIAQLERIRAEVDRLNASRDRLMRPPPGVGPRGGAAGGAGAAGGGFFGNGPWWTGLLPLAPAAIPLAAVGAAGGATLLLGLNQAKKSLAQLTPEYRQLQAVAGKSLAPGLDSLVHAAKVLEPAIAQMSRVFGGAISHEATLFSHALTDGGFQQFVSYAEANLPTVLDLVNNLALSSANLVRTLAPLGTVVLRSIDDASKGLSFLSRSLAHGSATAHGSWASLLGPGGHVGMPHGGAPSVGGGKFPWPGWISGPFHWLQHATGLGPQSASFPTVTSPAMGMLASTRRSQVPAFVPALQYAPSGALLAQLRQQESAVRALTTDYINLRNAQLNEANAQDSFHVQADQLGKSVAGLGHSLNVNTSHGAQLRHVLDGLVTAAQNGAHASKDYGYVLLHNIDFLKKKAEAQGYWQQLKSILQSMNMMPKQIKSQIDVQTWAARYNINQLQSAIDALPTFKTITIDARYTTSGGSPLAAGGSTYNSQVPRHHAMGGWIGPNEFGQVGELGYENYLSDSMGRVRIFSNAQSRRMGSGGGSRGPMRVTGKLSLDANGNAFLDGYIDDRINSAIDRYDAGF